MIVRSYVRTHGLRATISNSCNNYGPYQHKDRLIPKTIDLVKNNKRPQMYGTGCNIREWLHVDDHAKAVWDILNNGAIGQSYLVGSGVERSNVEVVSTILKAFGKDPGAYDLIDDRAGHDRRYALDHTKLTNELGWVPEHLDFEASLYQLVSCVTSSI